MGEGVPAEGPRVGGAPAKGPGGGRGGGGGVSKWFSLEKNKINRENGNQRKQNKNKLRFIIYNTCSFLPKSENDYMVNTHILV